LWDSGNQVKSHIARIVKCDESTVRKTLKRYDRTTPSPATGSSLETSRTEGNQASDPSVVGPAHGDAAGVIQGSGEESTDEAQGRNEPVSAEPVSAVPSVDEVKAEPTEGYLPVRIAHEVDEPRVRYGWSQSPTLPVKPTYIHNEDNRKPPAPEPLPRVDFDKFKHRPGDLIGLDMLNSKVLGPRGAVIVAGPMLRTLKHIADGQMYPVSVIQVKGGWNNLDNLRQTMSANAGRLKEIGVELVAVGRDFYQLKSLA
jgi:hypothetical protein